MRTFVLALVVAALAVDAAPSDRPTARIVNGSRARVGDFPYVVEIFTKPLFGTKTQLCVGTILNDNHVLTAASCVQGHNLFDLSIMAAGVDSGGSAGFEEFVSVSRVFLHEKFDNETRANDIAVVKTGRNFVFVHDIVYPVTLPLDAPEPAHGTPVVVPGWGLDKYEGHSQQTMHVINGTYMNNAVCTDLYGSSVRPDNACLMTEPGQGVCDGDEGSPIMADSVQVALVSWQVGCDAYPAVLTRVLPYLDWILSKFEV